ncbi:MAG: hypothetical protein LBV67_06570 [Streptococcaceae bacterium]|jgi:galactose-1-phosphate uridylyltransferase|nr:hypothetical protein [Streptococcaceae bacterium]
MDSAVILSLLRAIVRSSPTLAVVGFALYVIYKVLALPKDSVAHTWLQRHYDLKTAKFKTKNKKAPKR